MSDQLANISGVTPRQLEFIKDLLAKRVYDLGSTVVTNSREGSALIEKLLAAPKRATVSSTRSADPQIVSALAELPRSRYAIPAGEFGLDFLSEKVQGELLFVEVAERSAGFPTIKRLHGSVGGFTRSRLTRSDILALAEIIKGDSYRFARTFGEHYSCCGKCGAELTDDTSRRLLLGPVCRKAFGF